MCTENSEVITIVHGNGDGISTMNTMCEWYEHDGTFIPTWLAGQEVIFIWIGKVPIYFGVKGWVCTGVWLQFTTQGVFCLDFASLMYETVWYDAKVTPMFKWVGKTYSIIFRRGTCQVLYHYNHNMYTMSWDHTEHNRTLPVYSSGTHLLTILLIHVYNWH